MVYTEYHTALRLGTDRTSVFIDDDKILDLVGEVMHYVDCHS